jgi:organic radical activating enzyme
VGRSTLFVRLAECDLRCRWCDSPGTWRRNAACRIEEARGTARFRSVPNPVPIAEALAAAEALELSRHRFASLTGGEPLLQPEAAAALAAGLRARGPRVLLETHGLLADALAQVIEHVDVVSMDWKLASDVRRAADPKAGPVAPFHREHARFLRVARRAPEVVVKLVITPASTDAELELAWREIAAVDPTTPVLLQPVTPFGSVKQRPPAARLLELCARAERVLSDVRVIPQTHPILGAL